MGKINNLLTLADTSTEACYLILLTFQVNFKTESILEACCHKLISLYLVFVVKGVNAGIEYYHSTKSLLGGEMQIFTFPFADWGREVRFYL